MEKFNERTESSTHFRMLGAELSRNQAIKTIPKKIKLWLGITQ